MLFYLIRHADPIYDPDSITDLGKRQAEAVGKRLALHGIDEIYSSPMMRAQQTAKPLSEMIKKPINIESWTYECWEEFSVTLENGSKTFCMNLPGAEYLSDENMAMHDNWYEMDCLKTSKAKEGWERISSASDEFFARLGYKREGRIYKITEPNDKKIALFCHAGFGSVLISHMLNVPPQVAWASFDISHSGVSIFNFKNFESGYTNAKCLVHSDLSHIYAENLPLKYNNLFYI
jgi:probable phosphoglycerate mutase